MDLRSQLPKIGTEIDGQVCLGDDEFKIFCGSRPDYEKFKTGYATESECVGALLGVGFPLDLIERLLEQQWNNACPSPDIAIDPDHPAFVRYIEVVSLFHEIMTAIDIGIAEGKIRVVLEYEGQGEWKFSDSKILDTDTFFSWMHERGYPIPDELAINTSLEHTDYSNLSDEEKARLAWEWKQPGPKHLTNKEINGRLYPDLKNDHATRKINGMVEKFRK